MIYHPTTPLEAVTLRKQNADTAVYLPAAPMTCA